MQIRCDNLPWALDQRLINILNNELVSAEIDDGVTITFRDPDYKPECGGYHPVEFAFKKDGSLLYITDYCFVGQPPMCELCKCLDFDFSLELFQNYGMDYPISEGRQIFKIWQSNFISYHGIDAYTTSIEPW